MKRKGIHQYLRTTSLRVIVTKLRKHFLLEIVCFSQSHFYHFGAVVADINLRQQGMRFHIVDEQTDVIVA